MGKLKCFDIVYDQSPSITFAGKDISGKVVISVSEPIETKGIFVEAVGFAKVIWKEKNHNSFISQSLTKYYSDREDYFHLKKKLWGQGERDILDTGHYKFPFSFAVPNHVPATFEGQYGHIRYYCKAVINRPWRVDHNAKKPFTVISLTDLNQISETAAPLEVNGHQTVGLCCTSDYVEATVFLARGGYVPGECLRFSAHINNTTDKQVVQSRALIKQEVIYHTGSEMKITKQNIKRAVRGSIAPRGTDDWNNVNIYIPAIPPSSLRKCRIINISYTIQFMVQFPGIYSNLIIDFPLIIGTIPLRVRPRPIPQPLQLTPYEPIPCENETPPPTYEECVFGGADIRDDSDNEFTQGELQYVPFYPSYREIVESSPS